MSFAVQSPLSITSLKPVDSPLLRKELATPRVNVPVERPEGPPEGWTPPKVHSEVKVGGKVVATIYEDGTMMTSNAAYPKLKNLPSMGEDCMIVGRELAELRAKEIAEAMGGSIARAEQTQAAPSSGARFQGTAPPIVFGEALATAARSAAARSMLDAQLFGQEQV